MALDVFTGQFTASGSTGNQAVTGVGFQGKAIIFYCTEREAIENANNLHRCVGFATSSTARGMMACSIDNGNATGDVDNDNRATRCILIRDHSSGNVRFEADFVSFDADGFTVDWIDSGLPVVFFVAIGGADLTDVDVGQFTKATSTGTDAITGVGFEPDLILLAGELNTTLNSTTLHSSFFLGAAISPTSRWVTHGSSEDGPATSDSGRNQRTDKVIYQTDENGTAIADVDLDSMDSDGFTLDYLTANGDANQYMYLALKGGAYNLGSFDGNTSTGDQAVTGVGFTPKMEVFTSFSAATSGSEVADNHFGLGSATSATARSHLFIADEDGQGTTDAMQDINDTACLRYLNESRALLAEADFVTQDSDGFTVDWGTVDAISREILYLAMDSEPVILPPTSFVSPLVGRDVRYKRIIDFSDGGEARFFEDPATGESYIAVKAPADPGAIGAVILRISIPTIVAVTYIVLDKDRVVLVDDDAAGGAVTVTLPPAVGDLRELVIKKLGTTGSVTIDGDEAETIDGALTKVLSTQYDVLELASDGANWWII